MKQFRFLTLVFAVLLIGLAACQAASAPPKVPTSAQPSRPPSHRLRQLPPQPLLLPKH